MTNSTELGPDRTLDGRDMPCSVKHGLIIQTFVDLKVGEYFILRNGHDPIRMRDQFEAAFSGAFSWEYVHQLPDDVAVRITKLKPLTTVPGMPPISCGHH